MSLPKIGILQGRLTASKDGSIQFFPFDNWEKEFEIASMVGFDCIELLVKRDSYERNPLWSAFDVGRITRLSKKFNISIPSVHGFYIKSPEYTDLLIELIKQSAEVGAKKVLLSFFDERALLTKEDKDTALKYIGPALDFAKKHDIVLGVETEMAASELKDFIYSFNHPNIGVYYDIGNMVSMGVDVTREIEFLGDLICGVHVKDRKINGGSVPIGSGDANFPDIFSALKKIGYSGPFIMQGARDTNVDDIDLNTEYLNSVRDWLEKTY